MRVCVLFLLTVLSTSSVAEEPELAANGFAKYFAGGSALYIGALFVDAPSTIPSEIKGIQNKRIEIKVVTERLSFRRFRRDVVRSMAINNSQQLMAESASAMEEFLGWFRNNLVAGDHIVLVEHDAGVDLLVNGVALTTINSPNLFNLLLNTWIGDIPPSRSYKAHILGVEKDPQVEQEFFDLQYSSERVAYFEYRKSEVEEIAFRVAEQAKIQSESVAIAINAEREKLRNIAFEDQNTGAGASESSADNLATAGVDAQETPPADQAVISSGPEEPSIVEASTQESEAASPELDLPDSVVVVPAVNAGGLTGTQGVDDQEAALEIERQAEEELFASRLYNSKLLVHSRSKIVYPRISRRLGQQDTIMASVTIDRRGRLVEYTLTSQSKYSTLNAEVEKAIRSSEPFPTMPEKISGEQYTFELPVTFALEN